jgi:putative spermidine/putrescine transport system substrate-binding protein
VLALEQVWSVTPGSPVKELAYAYVDYMLRPDVQ